MKAKKRHRYQAFLRLYGPREAPTHAMLVIPDSHQPDEGTPEHFLRELAEERRVDAMLKPLQRLRPLYVKRG
jgi:hypothetical protein